MLLHGSWSGSGFIVNSSLHDNLVVAQTHLAFLKFHNQVIDTVQPDGDEEDDDSTLSQDEEDRKKPASTRHTGL